MSRTLLAASDNTALPSDVRKVLTFRKLEPFVGLRPLFRGAAPLGLANSDGGAEPPPHIRRQSREHKSLCLIVSFISYMAVRPIVDYPAGVLLEPGEPVVNFDSDLEQLTRDMFETMYQARGVGL